MYIPWQQILGGGLVGSLLIKDRALSHQESLMTVESPPLIHKGRQGDLFGQDPGLCRREMH